MQIYRTVFKKSEFLSWYVFSRTLYTPHIGIVIVNASIQFQNKGYRLYTSCNIIHPQKPRQLKISLNSKTRDVTAGQRYTSTSTDVTQATS